MLKHLMS